MFSWLSACGYRAAYALSHLLFTLGFSLRTSGSQLVPAQGPVLLLANHQSFLDPVLVALAIRRRFRAVARKTLFRPPLFAWLLRQLGAIPLGREGVGKEGLRTALQELERGQAVLLFPEGTRTPDGRLQALRPGVHLLLRRAPVPVVVVGIAGAYQAWPSGRPFPLLAPLFLPPCARALAVSILPPQDGRDYARLPREQALQKLFHQMQQAVRRAERLQRKA